MLNKKMLAALWIAGCAANLVAEGVREPWRDPRVNSINRLPARAVMVPCESAEKALAIARGEMPRTESAYIESLDGEWDFSWKACICSNAWQQTGKIAVPGCWQLQGDYDPPLYSNIPYPIVGWEEGDPMAEPPATYTSYRYRNPVGLYRRTFKVPAAWRGRRVTIHFGGVSSAMYVRLNGRQIGYSEDSRLPAEFDLTPALVEGGENTLEVEVLKHCDGSFLEDQDFWRLSGIFRSVWLVAENPHSPRDLVLKTSLADDYSSGVLTVCNERGETLHRREAREPRLWSCESPHLDYEVFAAGGDWYALPVGWRKIEIRDSVVYINGKRALFMGVDRHEMHPRRGYSVTREDMERDIEIFRDLNINAVRTSHYPNDPLWYELCDRAGIYVVCEANIESHGAGYGEGSLAKNPRYFDAHIERGVNMVKTFRNHPSIIFWSLGNEGGDGPAFVAEYQAMRALDATRPIQYEQAQDAPHSDIKCPMYTRPWVVEAYVSANPSKPFILCEYAHAMGNSNGDIHDYWDLVYRYPSAQGGFIWDFADQALWKSGPHGDYLAYGGDFGDFPNSDNFNCNGIVAADRSYHPGAFEVKHAYQPISVVAWDWQTKTAKIRNNYRFTSLAGLNAHWVATRGGEILRDGRLDLAAAPDSVIEVKIPEMPDCAAVTFLFMRKQFSEAGMADIVAHDQFVKPFEPVAAPQGPSTRDLVARFFKPNFWRAPTDNDRGWGMDKVCAVWKRATESGELPEGVETELDAVRLKGGPIVVDYRVKVPADKQLPPLPRVGVSLEIPAEFTSVEWRGLGPWENYPDRRRAALFGDWKAVVGLLPGVADPQTGRLVAAPWPLNPDNYSEPGEQGYRCGVTELVFTSADGRRICIRALNAPFGFNAWPYSQNDLEKARHQTDLVRRDVITVNIDAAMMGVGGDDSWGARPHDSRMLGAGEYRLNFTVEGL